MKQATNDESRALEYELIEGQAAEWLARHDRGLSPEEAAAFSEWLAADPRRQTAVADLRAMWGALDALRGQPLPQSSTPAAPTRPDAGLLGPKRHSSGRWLWFGLAAAAAVAVGVGTFIWKREPASRAIARYETAVGQQTKVTLPDGTELQLNTDSLVEVRYTTVQRRVALERGEAYFAVAKNPAWPFVVQTGTVEAQAVGTAFLVRRAAERVELVVTEGCVRFGSSEPRVVEARAQQLAVVNPGETVRPQVTDLSVPALARRLAWQSGLIEFQDTPLSDAVAEINRYNRVQLRIADPETATVLVGGTFRVDNQEGFLRVLATAFDIDSERAGPGVVVLSSRRR